jgi:hypothetical protein
MGFVRRRAAAAAATRGARDADAVADAATPTPGWIAAAWSEDAARWSIALHRRIEE